MLSIAWSRWTDHTGRPNSPWKKLTHLDPRQSAMPTRSRSRGGCESTSATAIRPTCCQPRQKLIAVPVREQPPSRQRPGSVRTSSPVRRLAVALRPTLWGSRIDELRHDVEWRTRWHGAKPRQGVRGNDDAAVGGRARRISGRASASRPQDRHDRLAILLPVGQPVGERRSDDYEWRVARIGWLGEQRHKEMAGDGAGESRRIGGDGRGIHGKPAEPEEEEPVASEIDHDVKRGPG